MDFLISILVLQLLFLRHDVSALKLRHINVPPYIFIGQTAHLECSFDLGSDPLYMVTWYKDNEEFYKYVPEDSPKQISHSVKGVNLNHAKSGIENVILENVNLSTRGIYKCDVIADIAGLFPSVEAEAYMEVVVPPKTNPRITGEEKIYATGDILTLNCTSDKSYPSARLTWFINGVKVNPDSETQVVNNDLVSTTSSLRLELGPHHLVGGQINIRCESLLETIDRMDSSHNRISQQLKDLRETQVFVQGNASTERPDSLLLAALLIHRIFLLLR